MLMLALNNYWNYFTGLNLPLVKSNLPLLIVTWLLCFVFSNCRTPAKDRNADLLLAEANITLCGPSFDGTKPAALPIQRIFTVSLHPRLIDPADATGFPKIQPNDNRKPAGKLEDGQLHVALEVVWGDFHPETRNRPGLRVAAIAEKGKSPTIPAPLIRVPEGTMINATIYNSLPDSTITLFGFQERPGNERDSVFVLPGNSKTISFKAGEQGTYLYSVVLGKGISFDIAEEEQLAGAFIIDPPEGSPPDRILVMNIFSTPIDETFPPTKWLEFLTINGKSWPFTEAFQYAVGETVRWRVINASQRGHPMHLHGFYYDVLSLGNTLKDEIYSPENKRKVVTETMRGRNTMLMEWVAMRPGRWLFHCHLSGHVNPEIRLPGSDAVDAEGANEHMAGLVIGINILDGETDLVSKGEPKELTMYAHQFDSTAKANNGFSFSPTFDSTLNFLNSPGPLLLLRQYQTTYITLENRLSFPTSVHWHGLEIDSWSDGVPEWSSSDGKYSPSVYPGEKFTYKLSAMRPGSFIYHSHLDDVYQLTSGLYGPIIVLGENEPYQPETDHIYIVNFRKPEPKSLEDVELNGTTEQPAMHTTVGVTHRLRLMNIAPRGQIELYLERDNKKVPIRHIAKDGMDLPENQKKWMKESPIYGVGETSDFTFIPTEPGTYTLYVYVENFGLRVAWNQEWVVAPRQNQP